MARWPTKPVTRYVAPTLSEAGLIRLEASAMTLIGAAPSRSRTRVMSPPELFFGFVVSRPVVVARRPSLASARPAAGIVIGVGRAPVPRLRTAPFDGRISSWPYGAASFPVTSRSVPRAKRRAVRRQVNDETGVTGGDREQRRSPEAAGFGDDHAGRPDGRPDRRASEPSRADEDRRRGRRDRRRGRSGVAVGRGVRGRDRASGSASDRASGVGAASGRASQSVWAVGVGVATTASSSPGSVAWIR